VGAKQSHAANLFEYGGKLFVSDLTLSTANVDPTPYMEYSRYLEKFPKRFQFKPKHVTLEDKDIERTDNPYEETSYKDFLAARNDIRERIREESKTAEKKTKLSVTPKKPDEKILQTDAMLK
jgi:hypothetical protein